MHDTDIALIYEFADALWLADGLAKNTLASYRMDLKGFATWLNEAGATLIQVD
ncbi:MAG TPA: site-specific integrase, partial [Rhodocyclaceae bacterium]|nr:site-specific integrase [Rhodocyclaceae bacterium]